MKVLLSWLIGPLAIVLGVVAAAMVAVAATPAWAALAALTHVLAAAIGVLAAERRRGGLLPAERDAAWVAALLVPCFGAALAWIGPRGRDAKSLANAHQAFEHYEARVRPPATERRRTPLTGHHDPDVAREIDVRRHQRVLRAGSRIERLNALRCLARLGRPRDMCLVRDALTDREDEVRLFAHALLDGSMERHGARIVEARERHAEQPDDRAAVAGLARAHFDLAASGVLDVRSSRYHYRAAARTIAEAAPGAQGSAETARLAALALARAGETNAAVTELAALPEELARDPAIRLAAAEIAFLARDLDRIRMEHAALASDGHDIPVWLATLAGGQAVSA